MIQENKSIVEWAIETINKNMDLSPCFTELKKIRGIGDKIASLFVRDLILTKKLEVLNVKNRHLAQPVDLWVWRIVSKIKNNNHSLKTIEIQTWILNNALASNLNPELVNMGMWFFGSKIAESNYHLETLLSHPDKAYSALKNYVLGLIESASELKKINF